MKLDQLRKIIREEVRSGMKEELQDMLNEAVRVASTPIEQPQQTTYTNIKGTPTVDVARPINKSQNPITEILNQTKASMTSEEYKNIYTGTSDTVKKPNFASMMASSMGMNQPSGPQPGLDISRFDFVKKAGEIYKKSIEIDKQKLG